MNRLFELSLYELGNALWKQVYLNKTLGTEEAKLALDALASVHRSMKKVSETSPLNVLDIAVKEGLTYYDAAYIQAAMEKGATLVTEDGSLAEVAGKYVKVVRSNEL